MGDGTNPALKEQLKGTPGMEQGYRFKQFHILKKMFQSAHFWLFTKLSFQCDTSAMSHHPQLPLYSQKNVDVSTAMASDLRWIQLLCEEAHSNTLSRSSELHKLCKRQDQEQTPSWCTASPLRVTIRCSDWATQAVLDDQETTPRKSSDPSVPNLKNLLCWRLSEKKMLLMVEITTSNAFSSFWKESKQWSAA